MELGKNILKLRKMNKLKSKDLAVHVGVKQSYISAIENGKKIPSIDVLQKIAKELNCTTSELLGEVTEQLPDDMKRLVKAAKDLKKGQVDAIISVVKEMGSKYEND